MSVRTRCGGWYREGPGLGIRDSGFGRESARAARPLRFLSPNPEPPIPAPPMKRYPLHTLLRLRAHRTDAARQVVLQKQRAVQACRDACTRTAPELTQLGSAPAGQPARLIDTPTPGEEGWRGLAEREWDRDWLGRRGGGRRERAYK